MAEKNSEDDVAEEMMRMMEEEAGGDEGGEAAEGEAEAEPEAAADDAAGFDEEILKAMQEEMAGGDAGEADTASAPMEDQMIQAMAAETGASTEVAASAVGALGGLPEDVSPDNLKRVLDVKLSVSIELGNAVENIETLLHWTEGSLIELEKVSGEPVDVLVNNKHYARGEVVVIAENFGVRITDIQPVPVRRV